MINPVTCQCKKRRDLLACTHANSWQGLTAILHPDTSIAALPDIAWYRHSEDETTLSAGMRTQRLARAQGGCATTPYPHTHTHTRVAP